MRNDSGYRRHREAARRKTLAAEKSGKIIGLLSMQILICLVILVAVYLLKAADSPLYERIRAECDVIVNQTGLWENAKWSDMFAAAVQSLSHWLDESPAALQVSLGWSGMGGMLRSDSLLNPPAQVSMAPILLTAQPKMPIQGTVTSRFGYRTHPITGKTDFHTGVDIAAAEGTAIGAALPGTVLDVGESEIYGRYVKLQHSDNLVTTYSHCSKINVDAGIVVRQGERIALVGHTGMATGPHLHFEIRVNGLCCNPAWVMDDVAES